MESKAESRGERFLHGAPGVYLHRDENKDSAENDCRFVKLDPEGRSLAISKNMSNTSLVKQTNGCIARAG